MDSQNLSSPSIVAPAMPPRPIEPLPQRPRKDSTKTFLIASLVVVCIALCIFIGLFIWIFLQYDEANTAVQSKIDAAVAQAVNINTTELELQFAEREKEPNKTFSGPKDYGELSFKYPKTWSVYVEQDASNGGDYRAYFSPGEVQAINDLTPNALRVIISTQTFDSTVRTYQAYVDAGFMTVSVVNIAGSTANVYKGKLPSQLSGAVCLIKIRDKTAILQTDANIYMKDYEALLKTVTYNS